MSKKIHIGMLTETVKENLVSFFLQAKFSRPNLLFADLRLEVGEGKVVMAENGHLRKAGVEYGMSLGVRVIAGDGHGSWSPGYDGRPVGPDEVHGLLSIVNEMVNTAFMRAKANAAGKSLTRHMFPGFTNALMDSALSNPGWSETPVLVPMKYRTYPMDYPLDEMKRIVAEISPWFKEGLTASMIALTTTVSTEFYANSLGVNIEQNFALSQADVAGVLGDTLVIDVLGHQRGPEIFLGGVHEDAIRYPSVSDFARGIRNDVLALSAAPQCPATNKETVVVTDPHYNTLLVHEIVGHPTELDRGVKMETAYAGRTWLLKGLNDTMVGKRIASPLVNAYSDPRLPGYGHYEYDHEGSPGKRVDHIKDGIFTGFMNSLQTIGVFGGEPNGHWKATDASLVPLIRMSNTVFGQGESDPSDLIGEVKDGYYLQGMSIPSISESRENFTISARKVTKIENGELTTLYRNGGMSADSRDYLMAVDGVGNDFQLFPIASCGKGQPMQVKKLGNGGPTLRSIAKITGGKQ